MTEFQLSTAQRNTLIAQMREMAEGTPLAQRAQMEAINALVAWYEGGEKGEEPYAEDVDGVTWKMACAISSDLRHIFKKVNPNFPFGSEYSGQYVGLRRAAVRQAQRRTGAKTGMQKLQAALTI